MANVNMKVKELLSDEKCIEILDRHLPGFSKDPRLKMGYGMTFRAIAMVPQVGLTPEQVDEIDKELNAV